MSPTDSLRLVNRSITVAAVTMGFFDSISDLFSAAAPWETSEAEAVREGGTGTDSTPAQPKGGEGEAKVCL